MRILTLLPLAVLALFAAPAAAKDCVLSKSQTAAVAKLPHPITRNAQGAWVQNGEPLGDDRTFEMCNARHMYELMVSRKAKGKRMDINEINPFDFTFLTDAESAQLKEHLKGHPKL